VRNETTTGWKILTLDEEDPRRQAVKAYDEALGTDAFWESNVRQVETTGKSFCSAYVFTTFTAPVPGGKRAALRETKSHVDSGAAASICSQKLVKQLGLIDTVEPLPESHRVWFLTTASGEFMRIAGTVTLSFTLQDGKEITHDCLVVPKYDGGMLLGNDFLLAKAEGSSGLQRSIAEVTRRG
jgi:hypothetical protein